MTVTNTTFQSTGTGDGVTTAFAFTWRIIEDNSVKVYVAEVLKTLGTDYTLTTNRLTTGLGGTVTFLVAPAASAAILIQRESDLLQSNNLRNNEAMPAATVMSMIDKLAILTQRGVRNFQSSDTTIAAGTAYTFAHGLGKVPERVQLCLVCTITDGGYAVGDVIDLPTFANFGTIRRDMTNIYLRTLTGGTTLPAVNKTTFAAANISVFANWKLRVYAS